MDNGFKGTIPDIGSMSMGTQGNVSRPGKVNSGGGGLTLNRQMLFLIAAVVIVIAAVIVIIAGAVEKRKVKDAFIERMTNDLDDIELEKYYPDEIAEALEEALESSGSNSYKAVTDEVDILGVSKIDIKKYEDQLMDAVMDMVEIWEADIKKRDIDISRGYVISYVMGSGKEAEPGFYFVIKVNGRYGAYRVAK